MDNCGRYSLRSTRERSFFIGSNTGDGFRLSPDRDLDEENNDRVIIIKGGPGTGKSTLMKEFSSRAERAGYSVTEYLCSSDPASLDAVRICTGGRTVLVCDGTSPHVTEMKYPGAVSSVFDLSTFWNVKMLILQREKIVELSAKKRECFERAASLLRAARETENLARSVGISALDTKKLAGFAQRCAAKIKRDFGTGRPVITSALSMNGAVTLDTHISEADEVVFVEDYFGVSGAVLEFISAALSDRGVSHEVSLVPEDHTRIEALYINGIKRLYTAAVHVSGAKHLNCARFVNAEAKAHRALFRFSEKCSGTLISSALDNLAEAKNYHFELERIYSQTMDFDAVSRLASKKLYSLL